jgi:hypothetical protein
MGEIIELFEGDPKVSAELRRAIVEELDENYVDLDDRTIDAIVRSILLLNGSS